jgi:hypothetical protein
VVATVVAAFTGDPGWGWFLGPGFDRLAPLFAGALFDQRVGGGTVWMTDDAASVSLWDPPGGPDPQIVEAVWRTFHDAAGPESLTRLAAYDTGRGLATAVMAPGLSRADVDGLDVCLETSTLANRAFYARRGFIDATVVDLDGGPDTWWLRRPPHEHPVHDEGPGH